MPRLFLTVSIAVLACLSLVLPAEAGVLTWQGDDTTTPTSWNVGENWDSGSVPATGDDVVFPSAMPYTGALTLDAAFSVNELTVELLDYFNSSTGTVDLANAGSGGPLTMVADGGAAPSITVTMPGANGVSGSQFVRFQTDIVLDGNLTITRAGTGTTSGHRRLSFNGDISGTGDLTIDNKGGTGWNYYVELWGDNTFVGDVKIDGGVMLKKATGLGNASNDVTFGTDRDSWLVIIDLPTSTLPYDLKLSSNRNMTIYSGWYSHSARTHTLSGDITGGGSHNSLDILTAGARKLVFASSNQTFTASEVDVRAGSEVTIAGANAGLAWENVARIDMMESSGTDSNNQQAFLLRGDFSLGADIRIQDTSVASLDDIVTLIGQENDGASPFDATFSGDLDVREDDFLTLHLTADAGGSATFSGDIFSNTTSFDQGFKKVGDGTVILTGRVSQQDGDSDSIGPVTVEAGTLLVNTNGFYADTVTVAGGATLGGTGIVSAAVALGDGSFLSPGASPGTLTVNGDLDISAVAGDGAGNLVFELETLFDQVVLASGTLSIGAGLGLDDFSLTILRSGTYTIFDTSNPIDGTLGTNLSDSVGGFHVTLGFGDGTNDLVLNVVPEPSTLAMLLGLGAVGLLAYLRRRRRS